MGLSIALLLSAGAAGLPGANACPPAVYAKLTAPEGKAAPPLALSCSVRLKAGDTLYRKLVVRGPASSGVTIDCGGGDLGYRGNKASFAVPTLMIISARAGTAARPVWQRPSSITVANCQLYGNIRTQGTSSGGDRAAQGRFSQIESRRPDFTAYAQKNAPSGIAIRNVTFQSEGQIPLYVGRGTTNLTLTGSKFFGRSPLSIYLDAESARNRIIGNEFLARTTREVIAVDGSAHNVISRNSFRLGGNGGIWLYRNCGEGGIIRHQTASYNDITDNDFTQARGSKSRAIFENARTGVRTKNAYCGLDSGYGFGSSKDDRDNSTGNILSPNRIR